MTAERNRAIYRLRSAGITYREIGQRYGISPARARQIVERADRKRRCHIAAIMPSLHIRLYGILSYLEEDPEILDKVLDKSPKS